MNDNKSDRDENNEYEEFAGLDLPLELTEEDREICREILNSAKPITKNYWLWKIKRSIFVYQYNFIELFNSASDFVANRQILSFILFFVFLMIIGFLIVFILAL